MTQQRLHVRAKAQHLRLTRGSFHHGVTLRSPCGDFGLSTRKVTPFLFPRDSGHILDIPTPTHAERARTMVAQLSTGTLCTVATEPAGYPYGSFVTVALERGYPVFLISELAEHTKNLRKDARASLLVAQGGADDPLANGRVTLVGDCSLVADPEAARAAYLERHPNAGYYADFKDFNFWRLEVAAVRYIGGYGRMSWVGVVD